MTPIQFVASANHDEARDFYSNTMGFELTEDSPFSFEYDTGGGMLRVQKVDDLTPHPFTALGWAVDDIAAARDRLAERGVGYVTYDFLDQDERGVWTAPDGAQVCWFRDPDGNTLSLTQFPI